MGYRVEETIEADTKSSAADLIATRVNGESIEVLSSDAVPIGEWAAFELKLSKGEVFLEGMGRCEACGSSGSGFRVRLGTLQFDVMNEVMFERVHLAAESMMTGERTGEIDIVALEALRRAEQAPRPSPSVAVTPSPAKAAAPISTPSWRPPPPMRSAVKAAPSSPPPRSSPPLRSSPLSSPPPRSSPPLRSSPPPPSSPSHSSLPRPAAPLPKSAPSAPPPSVRPAPIPRPKISMNAPAPLAPIDTTRTNISAPGEFSPSGFPPPLPRPAPVTQAPAQTPTPVPVATAAPAEPKPSTVSGYPAPPPEGNVASVPVVAKTPGTFSPRSPGVSSLPPAKDDEAVSTARTRLKPLLLAMRRAGAARHIEDAEELAMELGLQALERIFGD